MFTSQISSTIPNSDKSDKNVNLRSNQLTLSLNNNSSILTAISGHSINGGINNEKSSDFIEKTPHCGVYYEVPSKGLSENVKYKNIITSSDTTESTYNTIDSILENEKISNKSQAWNKLDKTVKIQKLHIFSEKYGKEHNIPVKEIKNLKLFFNESLDKNKLQKTKDVNYDKEKGIIISIPALTFNQTNHNFTLKNMDSKHVSTIKSLTPKRIIGKIDVSNNL